MTERRAADQELLRQLIVQVTDLATRMEVIFTALTGQRANANHRLGEMEGQIHMIELSAAERKAVPDILKDHEFRIRSLEGMRWQLLALAFIGSALGWLVSSFFVK